MNVYQEIASRSVASLIRTQRESGILHINDNGKLSPQSRRLDPDQWLRTCGKGHDDSECRFANMILWRMISEQGSTKFVPSYCQGCWKVVAKPKTFKQLIGILELQDRQDRRAKCGIETRAYVPALYGAYWYNRSIEEGLETYEALKSATEFKDVPLLLKRGCTEMEMACGPSDMWDITDWQIEIEDGVRNLIEDNLEPIRGLVWQREDTILRWMEFAEEHGDETIYEFTDGHKIKAPNYITYHEAPDV